MFFLCSVSGHIQLGFSGFNKPPLEGDQLTHRLHTVSIKTNTNPNIIIKTITILVYCFFVLFCFVCLFSAGK